VKNLFNTINKILTKIELILLLFFFAIIFIAASIQIFLHNLGGGIPWLETLLKYSVLWVGLIAANIATTEDKQIKIDVIGRFIKGRSGKLVSIFANFAAFIVCAIIFIYFIKYLRDIEYKSTAAKPFLNIPRWALLLIVPFSFFSISIKYLIFTIRDIINFFKNRVSDNKDVLADILADDIEHSFNANNSSNVIDHSFNTNNSSNINVSSENKEIT